MERGGDAVRTEPFGQTLVKVENIVYPLTVSRLGVVEEHRCGPPEHFFNNGGAVYNAIIRTNEKHKLYV